MTAFALRCFALIALCLVFVHSAPTTTQPDTEIPEMTVHITDAPPSTPNPGPPPSTPNPGPPPSTPNPGPPPSVSSPEPTGAGGNPTSAPQKESAPGQKSGASSLSKSLTLSAVALGLLLCKM